MRWLFVPRHQLHMAEHPRNQVHHIVLMSTLILTHVMNGKLIII